MPRPRKDPLRRLTRAERRELGRLRRSRTAPAAAVTRATLILLVRDGHRYQDAARAVGRTSGDAAAHLVARFNHEGLAAVTPRHGGGPAATYDTAARERIPREVARVPTPEADGTATWSLSIPRRVLRAAPDGLPRVSTDTIRWVLREAGDSFQRTRTWCPTGRAVRQRKSGRVTVTDPDAGAKESGSRTPTGWHPALAGRCGGRTKPGRSRRSHTRAGVGGPRANRRACHTSTPATARPRC